MSDRLAHLRAFHVFDAVARTGSFTKAAESLFVTQAAVSQQIKLLEDYLGVSLFRRINRNLLMTEEAQILLPYVRQAFEKLSEGVAQLQVASRKGLLTVTVIPSFASRWLVPRLGRFVQQSPDIEVRIAPSLAMVDFDRSDVDLGIRFGRGRYPGLHVEFLMADEAFPVCSPQYLESSPSLAHPSDLRLHTLIHDDGPDDLNWNLWLKAAGAANVDIRRGLMIDDSSLVVDLAMAGQGIALARRSLIETELAAGRLLRPFALSIPTDFAYYLVMPARSVGKPKVQSFAQWLKREIAEG